MLSSIIKSNIKLAVICPMANEKETAVNFVKNVLEQCDGFKSFRLFLIFDKKCTDGTYELVNDISKQKKFKDILEVVNVPENTCVTDAYVYGYNMAINYNADWILEIDAGFSHLPSQIPEFFKKMEKGYDCVFGSRFCKGGKIIDVPINRKIISMGGSIITNILLGTKLKDMTSGFELFTKKSLKHILDIGIISKGHFFQTEIKTYCRNMNIVEIPIIYKSPSNSINMEIIFDSFKVLIYLFIKKLKKQL